MKIGMPKVLTELRECTCCHGYTQTGYELRDNNVSRFVCDECYQNFATEYPICGNMIEINRNALSLVVPNEKKPHFQAGYLLGKKKTVDGVQKLVITDFLNCLSSGKGTVSFFAPDDVMKIRKRIKEKETVIVGLYRTSPSGSPDFNSLDTKTIGDMVNVMPYVIIGGCSEILISVRDKNYPEYEYGVTIV